MKDVLTLLTNDVAELEVLKIKSKLMIKISKKIKQDGLTQNEAALKIGTTQSRISKIYNGKLGSITIDFLIICAIRLNIESPI